MRWECECGGKGGFIPIPQFIFKASCAKHDVSYSEWWDEAQRIRCDTWFLRYMLIDAHNSKHKVWYTVRAYVYYFAVRLFWFRYFNYRNDL